MPNHSQDNGWFQMSVHSYFDCPREVQKLKRKVYMAFFNVWWLSTPVVNLKEIRNNLNLYIFICHNLSFSGSVFESQIWIITFPNSKRVNFFKDTVDEIPTLGDFKNTLLWIVLFNLLNVILHVVFLLNFPKNIIK